MTSAAGALRQRVAVPRGKTGRRLSCRRWKRPERWRKRMSVAAAPKTASCKAAALPTCRREPDRVARGRTPLDLGISQRGFAERRSGGASLPCRTPARIVPPRRLVQELRPGRPRAERAAAVNLVIDSDTLKSTSLSVPCGTPAEPHRDSVLFDRPEGAHSLRGAADLR